LQHVARTIFDSSFRQAKLGFAHATVGNKNIP